MRHVYTIPNRKSPPAVLLRESHRGGGCVKKRTLANLSKLPQALIDGIGALHDDGKISGKRSAEPGFEIVRSLPHGHVAAVKAMIGKLGLERTLQGRSGIDKRVRNLIEAMIIQRIIAPGSKLAFHRALAPLTSTSSLALSVGLIDVAEREVYAALDWLIEQQTRIEAALAQRHLADGTLVLYDVSSSYMEGRCCALAKRWAAVNCCIAKSPLADKPVTALDRAGSGDRLVRMKRRMPDRARRELAAALDGRCRYPPDFSPKPYGTRFYSREAAR